MQETKQVTEFTFLDFMKAVEENILAGYRLDFDKIENVPQRFGNTYECIMLKKEVAVISPMLTPAQVQELIKGGIMLAGNAGSSVEPAGEPVVTSTTTEVGPDVVVQSTTAGSKGEERVRFPADGSVMIQASTLLHTGPTAEAKPIGTAVEEAPVAQLATRKGKKQ